MSKLDGWICACEAARNGKKCDHCTSSILNDFSDHECPYYFGSCRKKSGW